MKKLFTLFLLFQSKKFGFNLFIGIIAVIIATSAASLLIIAKKI